MLDEADSLLRRQRLMLARRQDESIPFVIAPLLGALSGQPALGPHLDDLDAEAVTAARAYAAAVAPFVPQINRAWQLLEQRTRAENLARYEQRVQQLLALHESIERVAVSMTRGDGEQLGSVSSCFQIVQQAFSELQAHRLTDPVLPPVGQILREAGARLDEAGGVLNVQSRQPAFALARLRAAAALVPDMQRPLRPLHSAAARNLAPITSGGLLELQPRAAGEKLATFVASAKPEIEFRDAALRRLVAGLREDLDDVLDELESRLGTVRSRRALVDRFVIRSERYDRRRLAAIAGAASGAEAALRDEFARFLFDAGLEPLTETSLATTRSDVLEPTGRTMLVEAKQYSRGAEGTLSTLVKQAYLQVVDTAHELRGVHAVDEAFVVVFRRSGGRLVFPEDPVRLGSIDFYFRLVDLAPAATTGSGAKVAVIEMNADDITQAADAASTPSTE